MPEDDSDDNNDDHDDEAKYEYIPDFDDLDGEFVLRLLVNLDSASKHKYPW